MSTERWEEVKRLFNEALQREPSDRAGFLDGLGELDPSLRKEVESLLASQYEHESFLEKPPVVAEGDSGVPHSEDTASVTRAREREADSDKGRRIGPYRILQELGHGGMGVVYEAEQEKPVHRRVALKLIKLGMDTKQVIARFESERQALALMNHPNIASVYNAGATEQGRPYFAMEYVQGIPITEYCDKHRLKIKERLELFIAVCEGVQHAHQKGIIHRDLKPSNVLVTIQNDKSVPKIIDFGVAKATAHRLTERTVYTELGQLIGTPEYMSPEQAEMTGLDIDTRTDVYSLGVILYELMVGAQPFDATELRRAGFEGIRRILREKEPIRPSTKVHSLGKMTTDSAKNRRVDPMVLERELRGDLDWITVKALEKDRTRRYGSPSEFAGDIRRHLRHEPVLASPPSTAYRVRKFVRRHTVGVAAVTTIAILLVSLLVGMTVQAGRIARERDRAKHEAAKSKAVTDFLRDTLGSADPYGGLGREVTVVDALGEAVRKIEESLENEREIKAALQNTIGYTYTELGRYEEAEPLLKSALAIRKAMLGGEHLDVAESLFHLGLVELERGDPQRNDNELADKHFGEALAIRRKLLGEVSLEAADVLNALGVLRSNTDDDEEAEALYRESLGIRRRLLANEHLEIAQVLGNLAVVLNEKGELDEAEGLVREALAMRRKLQGVNHPDVATSLASLGWFLFKKGSHEESARLFAESLGIYEKALDPDHWHIANVRSNYGECLTKMKRYEEAEELLLAAHSVMRSVLGVEHRRTNRAVQRLMELYESWGKPEKAAEYRALLAEK